MGGKGFVMGSAVELGRIEKLDGQLGMHVGARGKALGQATVDLDVGRHRPRTRQAAAALRRQATSVPTSGALMPPTAALALRIVCETLMPEP